MIRSILGLWPLVAITILNLTARCSYPALPGNSSWWDHSYPITQSAQYGWPRLAVTVHQTRYVYPATGTVEVRPKHFSWREKSCWYNGLVFTCVALICLLKLLDRQRRGLRRFQLTLAELLAGVTGLGFGCLVARARFTGPFNHWSPLGWPELSDSLGRLIVALTIGVLTSWCFLFVLEAATIAISRARTWLRPRVSQNL
jgi:hypothetical protein